MKVMTTEEALLDMLSERGISNKLGLSRSTVSGYKKFLRDKLAGNDVSSYQGRISQDKMQELLEKGGYAIAQERMWTKPV